MKYQGKRLIRSATLRGYAEAASSVGLDPLQMLSKVGLDPGAFDEPERMISFDTWLELLAQSAATSGYQDFAMRAAIARGVPDYGPVTLLMREAENVEAAIQLYSSHLGLHADGTFIQLDKRFESPFIVMEVVGATREQSVQGTQYCVVGVTMQIRWLTGGDFQPELVSFSHSKGKSSSVAQRFFRCPVTYNQVLSGMVIPRSILAKPLVTSQPFLRKLALQHLEPVLKSPANTFTTRVRLVAKQMLEAGECSAQAVAAVFGIDRRTLNRRLSQEGENFSSVIQHLRLETTRQAIRRPNSSLAELADQLGFQSLSAFSRWFQSTFGCSASQWRKQAAADQAWQQGDSLCGGEREIRHTFLH